MSAPISVVIPTFNSELQLPRTLWSLMEGVDSGLIREVIISDGGSTDETQNISINWGAKFVTGETSRGGQLRRGVATACGDFLLIVHSDTILESGWASELQNSLSDGPICFSLAFNSSGIAPFLVAFWANLRTDFLRLPFGDQALFLSRELYYLAGGYPDQRLMEDVALVIALKTRVRRTRWRAFTSSEKYQRQGWINRGTKNLILLVRYLLGTEPDVLAKAYYQPSEDPN
mgnify:FL=1